MGLASSLSNKAKSSGDYRTGVLNDFSIVSKANFNIFTGEVDASKIIRGFLPMKFKLKDSFPVQINPSNLSFSHGSDRPIPIEYPSIEATQINSIPRVTMPERTLDSQLDITLKYDVYDEYAVRTNDGAIGSDDEISLMSSNATSLKALTQYAGLRGYYTLFSWGEIEYFGLLTKTDVSYDAFSRWGTPLKATANITIQKQPLGIDGSGKEATLFADGFVDTASSSQIKTEQKKSDMALQAVLIATQALR